MKLNTLYEILNNSVKSFSERIAFSLWRGASYTYKQVGEKVAEVQELLRSAGLKKGDKVVLLSSNMPNWGVCYFAITTGGYTVVPVLPDFTSADLDRIVEHSEAKAMCVSDKLFTKISVCNCTNLCYNAIGRNLIWYTAGSSPNSRKNI